MKANFIEKLTNYFKEVKIETKKVNWPTRNETIKYSLIVIGISIGVALFLGACDAIFTWFLKQFIL